MSAAAPPHPDLGRLAALIGRWVGEGRGTAPSGDFAYREEVTFGHSGKPFLAYSQRTWALDDGRPLHAETGWWRAAPEGRVEVVLAHPIGQAEIELGRFEGTTLRLATSWIQHTPTGKSVTRLERDVTLDGDELRYELRMAMDGGTARFHLSAALHRAG